MSVISLTNRFAGLFSSFAIIIIGFSVFYNDKSVDYYSVFHACKIAIPGAIAAGILGFSIGKFFEDSHTPKTEKKKKKISSNSIEDLLIDDLDKLNSESSE